MLLVAVVIWCGNLEYRKLSLSDEGRYSEIPRYMAQSGDWLTPRLNGIKYFEKPPLQYWATAAAYRVFGEHHWTARLWPALTGLLGVLLMYFVGARLYGATAGLYTALVLAQQRALLGARPHPHARHGARIFPDGGACGHPARTRSARGCPHQPALDARRRRGLRAGGIEQRPDRHRPAGRGRGALHAGQARFLAAAQIASRHRAASCFWRSRRRGSSRYRSKIPSSRGSFSCTNTCSATPRPFISATSRGIFSFPILLAGILPWLVTLIDALINARKRLAGGRDFDPLLFTLLWAGFIFAFFSAIRLQAALLHPAGLSRAGARHRAAPDDHQRTRAGAATCAGRRCWRWPG